jgi:ankyrin repeat protein
MKNKRTRTSTNANNSFMKTPLINYLLPIRHLVAIGACVILSTGCSSVSNQIMDSMNSIGMPPQDRLNHAVRKGDVGGAESALAQGADVNKRDVRGFTPVMNAARTSDTNMVRLLLAKGADVNARVISPRRVVTTSIQTTQNGLPNTLSSQGTQFDQYAEDETALMIAAREGDVEVVNLLLNSGADVNASKGSGKWVGHTALMSAVQVKIPQVSGEKEIEIVRMLLDKGADVNARQKGNESEYSDNGDETVLMLACRNDNLEIVKLLVSRGADINTKTEDGNNALAEAAATWEMRTVQYLLSHGADINACGGAALSRSHGSMIVFLQDNGADGHAKGGIIGDYFCATNDTSATITGYIGAGGAVTIPGTINGLPVTGIGPLAFKGCTALTSIMVPNSVTNIGVGAFNVCTALRSVTIPNHITSIGNNVFNSCASLTSITIPNSVTSIGNAAFNGCKSLASVTIPNGVTSIGENAFASCASLTSITIPAGVNNLGKRAFAFCDNLNRVNFQGNAPSIGPDSFYRVKNATVYYLPGTTGWGETFGGRPTKLWKE